MYFYRNPEGGQIIIEPTLYSEPYYNVDWLKVYASEQDKNGNIVRVLSTSEEDIPRLISIPFHIKERPQEMVLDNIYDKDMLIAQKRLALDSDGFSRTDTDMRTGTEKREGFYRAWDEKYRNTKTDEEAKFD